MYVYIYVKEFTSRDGKRHMLELHHWSAACIYSSISFELRKCSLTAAFPSSPPPVQAGSSTPPRAWWFALPGSPLCRAEKRRFEATRARLAPTLLPHHPLRVGRRACHPPIYSPLAPLAATTADTKTITNRFARAMGRGQREVGRRRREAGGGEGERGSSVRISLSLCLFGFSLRPTPLSFPLVPPSSLFLDIV